MASCTRGAWFRLASHPGILLAACAVIGFLTASPVAAQPAGGDDRARVGGVAAWTSLWDDETFLGRGPHVGGTVGVPLAGKLLVEGEIAWADHHRDSGYLIADGNPVFATARLAYLFRDRAARSRPFASIGLALVHSTGTFTTRSVIPGPGGFPVEGPTTSRDWSLTKAGLEFGGGVEIGVGERLVIRPEVRWTATGSAPPAPSTLEPPIIAIRAGVAVQWRLPR